MQARIVSIFNTVIAFSLMILTVAVLPTGSLNPTISPKAFTLSVISTFAIVFLIFVQIRPKYKAIGSYKGIGLQTFPQAFFIYSTLILFFSTMANSSSMILSLFGTEQRRTGFFYYFALFVLVLIFTSLEKSIGNVQTVIIFLAISNSAVSFYWILQSRGWDYVNYENLYTSPSSFLGNPNFVSGFIGFSCWSHFIFWNAMNSQLKRIFGNSIVLLLFSLNIYILFKNGSVSGPTALLSSLMILMMMMICSKLVSSIQGKKRMISATTLLFLLTSALFSLAASNTLQSLLIRFGGDTRVAYWRAALRMFRDSPWLGKGPEAFASNFLRFRNEDDLNFIGNLQIVDSPHNLILEILSVGGIALFISVFLLFFLGLQGSLIRFVFCNPQEIRVVQSRQVQLILTLCIVGFVTQSLINVSNVAVCAWGFVLISLGVLQDSNGLFMSDAKNSSNINSRFSQKFGIFKRDFLRFNRLIRIWNGALLVSLFISIFGVVGNSQLIKNEMNFQKAASAKDGNEMIQLSKKWPENERLILGLSKSLDAAGYESESLDLLLFGAQKFPDEISIWIQISKNKRASSTVLDAARSRIMELDPLYGTQMDMLARP